MNQSNPKKFVSPLKKRPTVALKFPSIIVDQLSGSFSIFHVLSHLQFLSITIWVQLSIVDSHFDDTLIKYIRKCVEIAILRDCFQKKDHTWLLNTLTVVIWTYFIATILYVIYSVHNLLQGLSSMTTRPSLFRQIIGLHFSVIFWIASIVLMLPLSHNMQYSVFGIDKDKTPYNGVITINIVLTIVNYALGCFSSLLCVNPFHTSGIFSVRTPTLPLVTFLFKAIMAPLIVFGNQNHQVIQVLAVMFPFMISTGRCIHLLNSLPYNEYRGLRLTAIWSVITCWISFVSIFVLIFVNLNPGKEPMITLYISIVPLPLVVKLFLSKLDAIIKKYMAVDIETLNLEDEVFKKAISFMFIIDQKNSFERAHSSSIFELYLYADLLKHKKICNNPDCSCLILLAVPEASEMRGISKYQKAIQDYGVLRTIEIFSRAALKVSGHNIKLFLAHMMLNERSINLHMALLHFASVPPTGTNFFVALKRELLQKSIQSQLDKYFSNKEENILNVTAFVDFYNDEIAFQKLIDSNSQKYIDFWTYYQKPDFKLVNLLNKGVLIEKEADNISHLWSQHLNQHEGFFTSMVRTYSIYLDLVRNSPHSAAKTTKMYSWKLKKHATSSIPKEITKDNMNLPDTMVLHYTLTKKAFNEITHISDNAFNLIGYNKTDLIGKDLCILFTKQIQTHLAKLAVTTTKTQVKTKNKGTGAFKTKQGYIVPYKTYITVFPYVRDSLTYISIIRTYQPQYEEILLDDDGFIDGSTKIITNRLNISTEGTDHLFDLCPSIIPTSITENKSNSDKFQELIQTLQTQAEPDKSYYAIIQNNNTHCLEYKLTGIYQDQLDTIKSEYWSTLEFIKRSSQGTRHKEEHIIFEAIIVQRYVVGELVNVMMLRERVDQKAKSLEHQTRDEDRIETDLKIPNEDEYIEFQPTIKHINLTGSKQNSSRPLKIQLETYSPYPDTERVDNSLLLPETNRNLLQSEGIQSTRFKSEANGNRVLIFSKRETESKLITAQTSIMHQTQNERKGELLQNQKKRRIEDISDKASSTLSEHNQEAKLEQAIYAVPHSSFTKYSRLIILLLIVGCIALLSVFLVVINQNYLLIKGNVEILKIASIRMNRLLDSRRNCYYIHLYNLGIVEDNRYTRFGIASIQPATIYYAAGLEVDLNKVNHMLREALNQTEKHLQQDFYSRKIPLRDDGANSSIIYRNTFDAIEEINIRLLRIIAAGTSVFSEYNTDAVFVIQNSLNELLLTSERISTVIINDNQYKFKNLTNFILYSLIPLFSGVVMILALLAHQIRIVERRNNFIELFLRIDPHYIKSYLRKVTRFQTLLFKQQWF